MAGGGRAPARAGARRPRPLQRPSRGGGPGAGGGGLPGSAVVLARARIPPARPARGGGARARQRGDLRRPPRRVRPRRPCLVGDGGDVPVASGTPAWPAGGGVRQRRLADLRSAGRRLAAPGRPVLGAAAAPRPGRRPAGDLRARRRPRPDRLRQRGGAPAGAGPVAAAAERGRLRRHRPRLPGRGGAGRRLGLAAALRRADRPAQGHRHPAGRTRPASAGGSAARGRWR